MKRSTKPKAPPPPLEADISAAVREYLAYRTDVIVWRVNTGAARLPGKGGKMRPVFFNVKGAADFSGVIVPWGTRLEIEIKRPERGEQSIEQRCFEARIKAAGAIYLLVTSVDECRIMLDDAIAELYEREPSAEARLAGITKDLKSIGMRGDTAEELVHDLVELHRETRAQLETIQRGVA